MTACARPDATLSREVKEVSIWSGGPRDLLLHWHISCIIGAG
jgi:hypothetical protein